jgi:hypothetical protein
MKLLQFPKIKSRIHRVKPKEQPEQVIDDILTTLEAHHQRQMDSLKAIIAGFSELHRPHLVAMWLKLRKQCPDTSQAKTLMVKHIMMQLDGGEGPVW